MSPNPIEADVNWLSSQPLFHDDVMSLGGGPPLGRKRLDLDQRVEFFRQMQADPGLRSIMVSRYGERNVDQFEKDHQRHGQR